MFRRFLLMAYALLYERFEQYFSCKEILLSLKKHKNNQKNLKLTKKDHITILIHLFTFTDIYLYFKKYQINGNIFKILYQKRIQDLCAENLIFYILGSMYFVEQSIQTNKFDIMVLFSQLLSFTSCFIVFL